VVFNDAPFHVWPFFRWDAIVRLTWTLYWLPGISVLKKCAHDDHPSDLILLIHITGKVFRKALALLVIGTDILGGQYRANGWKDQ